MFETLPAKQPDAILKLMAAFREDTRANKIDLGVGIYKDAHGATPVMQAVKSAETKLLQEQNTKAYVGPLGSPAFTQQMITTVFGKDADTTRLRGAQAPGGSGALRVIADLINSARPDAKIWVSDPTWPNHGPLLQASGANLAMYPYYDAATTSITFDAMLDALKQANQGDVVLLHGCCHNPTGADLSHDQWSVLIELLGEKELMPFVDIAYQGFGDGMEEDAWAIRELAKSVPEMMVAASCSKNLGLYRERVGAALLLGRNAAEADLAISNLSTVIRSNYSMPPDHGAHVVELVLNDSTFNANWREELEAMRLRMTGLRQSFADAMRKRTNSDRFDFLANQKGMFSRLPLTPEQIETLRANDAIYLVGDGRINVAGLPDDEQAMDTLASSIAAVL